MSDLYTCTFKRKKIVSIYDKRGRKTGEKEELIAVTHTGLPAATVAGYRKDHPDVVVTLEPRTDDPRPRKSEIFVRTEGASKRAPAPKKGKALPKPKSEEAVVPAQDYAGLVNTMMEKR